MNAHEKFEFLVVAALQDGRLDEEEKKLLGAFAHRLGVPDEEAIQIIKDIHGGQEVPLRMPETAEDREQMLLHLIELVVSDEAVTADERNMLYRFGKAFDFPRGMVDGLLSIALDERKRTGKLHSVEDNHQFRVIATAAVMDGKLDDEEVELLLTFADRLNVARGEAKGLIDELIDDDELEVETPESIDEREKLVIELIEAVVDDKVVSEAERKILQRVAKAFAIPEAQINGLVAIALENKG